MLKKGGILFLFFGKKKKGIGFAKVDLSNIFLFHYLKN
jgi:uncharacterized protein YqgQ